MAILEVLAIVRQRISLDVDAQAARLRVQTEQIMAEMSSKGTLQSGMTVSLVGDACAKAAKERYESAWNVLRNGLTSTSVEASANLAADLKAFLVDAVFVGDLHHQIRRVGQLIGEVSTRGVEQVTSKLEGAIAAARSVAITEIDLFVLALNSKPSPIPIRRDKQQKFGILDAPNLYAIDLARRRGPLGSAVLYADLDDLKALNTKFTETKVDELILPRVHSLVAEHVEGLGFAYAEGGDEFKVYLPNTTLEMAVNLAEAIRRAIAELRFGDAAMSAKCTMSIGVAHVAQSGGTGDLSLDANKAKAEAKEAGKNQVVVRK